MRNGTDANRKKLAPILCAAAVILVLLIYLSVLLFPILTIDGGGWLVVGVLVLCVLGILTVIGGVLLALGQRLREIRSGEEEDAKKY